MLGLALILLPDPLRISGRNLTPASAAPFGEAAFLGMPASHKDREVIMPNDPSKHALDADRITINQEVELYYWSGRFGVSPDELKKAVQKVGPMVEDLRRELEKAAWSLTAHASSNENHPATDSRCLSRSKSSARPVLGA